MEETMFELITEKQKLDEKLNSQMIKLGWFFFEAFNQKGDYSKIMKLLERLNPEYVTNQKETYQEICALLNVNVNEQAPAMTLSSNDEKVHKTNILPEGNVSTENCESEVSWYSKIDGIIKIINESDFKLVLCSTDLPDHLKERAKNNNFPIRILEHVTLESIQAAEQKAREAQKFWSE